MTVRFDHEEEVLDQAIAWHQALAHDDADWDGYLVWLDGDPEHRKIYDEVASLDRAIDEHADHLRATVSTVPMHEFVFEPANDGEHAVLSTHSRRWWIGGTIGAGAIAAALAFVMAVPQQLAKDSVYETATGESHEIALGDGETVQLAPASRLIARQGDPHRLELARGEAFFSIAHDPARVLSVKAGGFAVTDIGTRFGVNIAADSVTVSVAEGQVTMKAAGGASRFVAAGYQLVGRAGVLSSLSRIAKEDVGSWRSGRLVYDQAPLRIVVADLARFSGRRVSVEPAIGDRPFSGALGISDGSRPFQNLADLMAITYKTDGRDVRFVAGAAR